MNPTQPALSTAMMTSKVSYRIIALNIMQIVGFLALAMAFPSAEMQGLLKLLPDAVAANIAKVAVSLLAAKPLINTICDLIDNGKLDKSWDKFAMMIIIGLSTVFFVGCISIDEDGCVLANYTSKTGNIYGFGPCYRKGEENVYGYRAVWTNPEGKQLRAHYDAEGNEISVEYMTILGWVAWNPKSGISIAGR